MTKRIFKNISFFANTGIGEFGTQYIAGKNDQENNNWEIQTVIANELLAERCAIYELNNINTDIIQGSITDSNVLNDIIQKSQLKKPEIATVSPPCQGASGLNAFKNNPKDFRNQLIKSFFQYLSQTKTINVGYIENVVSYYSAYIPGLADNTIFWSYVQDEKQDILNYPYMILSKQNPETIDELNMNQTNKNNNKNNAINIITWGTMGEQLVVQNQNSSKNNQSFVYYIAIENCPDTDTRQWIMNNDDLLLIEPIKLKDFIQLSFDELGYDSQLDWVRGDEYGAPQIRIRGFYVFNKKHKAISYPQPLYKTAKDQHYNGKTILDALLVHDLIEILSPNDIDQMFSQSQETNQDQWLEKQNIVLNKKDNLYYKDKALNVNSTQATNIIQKEKDYYNQSEMHIAQPLNDRYYHWVQNTPEGQSCYFNDQVHHRPYKIIEINSDNKKKNNFTQVIDTDDFKSWVGQGIVNYQWFIPHDIETTEKDFDFNGKKNRHCRNWQIVNSTTKNNIIQIMEFFVHACFKKDFQVFKDNVDFDQLYYNKQWFEYLFNQYTQFDFQTMFLFLPIKGFEQATYKRASLHKPSSALTTKMNIGNSNTLHPVFNRTWTPQEVMVLFGLGYVLLDDEYHKVTEYRMKKYNTWKKTANMVYEICGEGIIAIVAQQFLKQLVEQYYELD